MCAWNCSLLPFLATCTFLALNFLHGAAKMNCCNYLHDPVSLLQCSKDSFYSTNDEYHVTMVMSPEIFSYSSFTHFINQEQLQRNIRIVGDTSTTDYFPQDRRWNKIYEVVRALASYVPHDDVLVMLDADLAVLDSSFDLNLITSMYPHADLIVAADALDLANTGFMIVRNTKWSRDFFSEWWMWRDEVECDQHAFNALYEELLNTSSTHHIAIVPNHLINTQWPVQDSFSINHSVLHLVGEPRQYREAVLRFAADQLCSEEPGPLLGITAELLQQVRIDRSMQILQQFFDECDAITEPSDKALCFEELLHESQYLCDITTKPSIVPLDLCSQVTSSVTTAFSDAVKEYPHEINLLRPLYNALVAQFRYALMISVEDGMEIYHAVEDLFDMVFERFGTSSVNLQIYNKCLGALNNALARYFSDRNDYARTEQYAGVALEAYQHNLVLLGEDKMSNVYVENVLGFVEAENLYVVAKQLLGDAPQAFLHFQTATSMIESLTKTQYAQKRKYMLLVIEQLLLQSLLIEDYNSRESIKMSITSLVRQYQLRDIPYSITMGIEQLDIYLSNFQSNSLL